MTYYLRPYKKAPGLDLEEHDPGLRFLRDQGLALMRRHKGMAWEGYNERDFTLGSKQFKRAPEAEEVSRIGQAIAEQIARRLAWDEWFYDEELKNLDWTFSYLEGEEGKTTKHFSEDWHIGAFTSGIACGLWVSNGDHIPFEMIGKREVPERAYVPLKPPFGQTEYIETLLLEPANEILSFGGNICVEFQGDMVHRRGGSLLPPGEVRFAFRINN